MAVSMLIVVTGRVPVSLRRPAGGSYISVAPTFVQVTALQPEVCKNVPRPRPIASERLVTWGCGVLAEGHGPGLQIRVVQESAYEPGWSADAGPIVVPQR
jgi:hypothetical protein